MTKYLSLITIFFFQSFICLGQSDLTEFIGGWKGELKDPESFHLTVNIDQIDPNRYSLRISNQMKEVFSSDFGTDNNQFRVAIDKQVSIYGTLDESMSVYTLFIKSGLLIYHIPIQKTGKGVYEGAWNIWMVKALSPPVVYLSVEEGGPGQLVAFPIFDDQRFTGTWAYNFKHNGNHLLFEDFKTGLSFDASLSTEQIDLTIKFAGTTLTHLRLEPYEGSFPQSPLYQETSSHYKIPQKMNDGWLVNSLDNAGIKPAPLRQMTDSIKAEALINTHSVLIAKDGELVYEKYFAGFDVSTPHDQRSASKSISSAVIGIAVDEGLFKSTAQNLHEFLPNKYAQVIQSDERKSKIDLHSLLTMSSGLDAIDFGITRNSVASEGNYQQSPNWLKTVIDAPMIHEPSTHTYYGSANPFLLGVALRSVTNEPVEYFMDKHLLRPLAISNYILQGDDTKSPYFGGGMYLQPRDMLKFGQLYLNNGIWKRKRIISKEWIQQSFKKHTTLENTDDQSEYGYLWWHHTYKVNGREITAIEARGAGGQYISILPDLNTVVVITSGNFNNGRFWQPELIIEDYILRAIVE
ncbi:MAG: serine hydrolase [Balneolaceae bacterium]|nr:serine hydrolase [Balneolaceae bacterium]